MALPSSGAVAPPASPGGAATMAGDREDSAAVVVAGTGEGAEDGRRAQGRSEDDALEPPTEEAQHAQALLPTVQCPPAHQSAVNGGVSFGMGKERPRRLAALLRQKSAGHQPHHGAIFNVIGHQCTPQVIDETQPSGGTARSRSCRSAA